MPFFLTSHGKSYPINTPIWCSESGELLDIQGEFKLPIHLLANRPPTLWRYREVIPISADAVPVSMGEGFTPLLPLKLAGHRMWVKQEQLFPTGSYKDRGATVLMTQAKYMRVRSLVQDSSGNAGCAIAAYAALAGIDCRIFLPADTAEAKIVQMCAANARIERVEGNREDTAAAAFKAAQTYYYASHCWNPFFLHGTKTFAYEICEQMNWQSPDAVVVPAGNGTLVLGAWLAFNELYAQGVIPKIPKIIGIQAAQCAPLVEAYKSCLPRHNLTVNNGTLAEGIAIADPLRGSEMLAAVRASGGEFLAVSEKEIVESFRLVAAQGFYIEPTSAATIAGAIAYMNKTTDTGRVVTLFSGHGLKSGDKILKMLANRT